MIPHGEVRSHPASALETAMTQLLLFTSLYIVFLLWHEPWFSKRLRPGEAA